MKPWLLNILACPIDKHHPLEAYFFRWGMDSERIKQLVKGTDISEEQISVLRKQVRDGVISFPSLKEISDVSGNSDAGLLRKNAVEAAGGTAGEESLRRLYSYLNLTDVAEGLLVCPECGRWYPIGCKVESIPELLPDELREKEPEAAWVEKWRKLLPVEVKLN